MGQKIHPIGFRLAVSRNWSSKWYADDKNFGAMLHEDIRVREYLKKKLGIDYNETTPCGTFTLKEGECMGACGDAPVAIVNNKTMCSWMTNDKLDALIDDLKAKAQEMTKGSAA